MPADPSAVDHKGGYKIECPDEKAAAGDWDSIDENDAMACGCHGYVEVERAPA